MALINEQSEDKKELELRCATVNFFPKRGDTSTVTQTTNRSTAVTINSLSGQITTNNASLAAGAEAKFTVNNSYVTATSLILITCAGGQTADTSVPNVVAVANGSFTIQLTNLHAATADTGAMVINFAVLGGN